MVRKIEAMYREYGICDGQICGDCCNLSSYTQSRTWYKCEAYGVSNSEATDWAKRNMACGLFDIPFDKVNRIPLMQKLKHGPSQIISEPIKGQTIMELE